MEMAENDSKHPTESFPKFIRHRESFQATTAKGGEECETESVLEDTDRRGSSSTSSNLDCLTLDVRDESSADVEKCHLRGDDRESKEAVEKFREEFEGVENGYKSRNTPLRLRRLPASFWREPNVPKDLAGKQSTGKRCFSSCGCSPLHPPLSQKDLLMGYSDYEIVNAFGSKYLDPAANSLFPISTRPGNFFPISKFSDPGDFIYADPTPPTWLPGAPIFPPAPSGRCSMHSGFASGTDTPGASPRAVLSATAALYGDMIRRVVPSNYPYGNCGDVMTDRLVSPVADDLWRLLPNRSMANVFSKRFHPYI